jgi:hypothetical protein
MYITSLVGSVNQNPTVGDANNSYLDLPQTIAKKKHLFPSAFCVKLVYAVNSANF